MVELVSHLFIILYGEGMVINALIPARSGSKRILGKNMKDFFGHPLMNYTIQTALDSGLFDNVAVSTDSKEIKYSVKNSFPWKCSLYDRPAEYAKDDSPDIEWIKHVLDADKKMDRLNADNHKKHEVECKERGLDITLPKPFYPDIIVILRPTNPFRTVEMLKRAMDEFLASDCDSMRAVEPVKQHPFKMWKIEGLNIIPYLYSYDEEPTTLFTLPTQKLQWFSPAYIQNASLEIIHTKTIEEHDNVCGDTIIPFFTEGYEGFDLNTPDDWILAEELVKRGMVKLPEMNG